MNATATQGRTGNSVELGHYETPEGARVLIGRRIEGVVHVFDSPQRNRNGRRFFVEAGFESMAELAVLIADYRRQAKRLGACPMSREAIQREFAMPVAGPSPSQGGTP
jgi:hypothetical protein